jgi:ribosomal protein L13E
MMASVVDLATETTEKAGLLSAQADSLALNVDASRQTVVSTVRTSVAEAA